MERNQTVSVTYAKEKFQRLLGSTKMKKTKCCPLDGARKLRLNLVSYDLGSNRG